MERKAQYLLIEFMENLWIFLKTCFSSNHPSSCIFIESKMDIAMTKTPRPDGDSFSSTRSGSGGTDEARGKTCTGAMRDFGLKVNVRRKMTCIMCIYYM